MAEAEVSLRLAEYLSELDGFAGHVDVAIDGASVSVGGAIVFEISAYLQSQGWMKIEGLPKSKNDWTGIYKRASATLRVHSRSGIGDVVASIDGRMIIAECKKGPLVTKPGSPERPLLNNALGQALLINASDTDIVVAAVPDSPAFRKLAEVWRERPRLKRAGIQIVLVNRDGSVAGLTIKASQK
ncbi:hypothetical protein [Brucella pituitosa]|uniref:Uncharacterized protein n=1 Tax=Brucella pituitosa TaxID=571256 RepID=A0A643F6T3_9HYPH|nr:hypothetical protein [Brucella pituitosa]KAB0573119.1 hypothetical protein F7Q93_01055 [Brucella pituitosa]